VSLIIAQKIWMEPYKQTKEFAILFPDNYNKDQLRLWERDLLAIIYNDTKIEPSLYGKIYADLKYLGKYSNSNTNEIYPNIVTSISDSFSVRTEDTMNKNVKNPSKRNLLDLYRNGVKNNQLKALGYSIYDFIDAGFQILDLRFANFSLKELLNVERQSRQPNGEMVITSYFTVFDLREQGGFTITDFLKEGFSLSDLKSSGFVELNFRNCGVSIRNLVEAGYSKQDLINLHFSPIQIMGYDLSLILD